MCSIAVHPDKVTIATGQVAGHEKQEGKVCNEMMMMIMMMILMMMMTRDHSFLAVRGILSRAAEFVVLLRK